MIELVDWLRWLLPRLGVAFPVAAALALALQRWGVPFVVWRLYRHHLPLHAFEHPNIDDGAGSEDFTYFLMVYDARDRDLEIEGPAPDSDYWMFGLNDRHLRAVDRGHANHERIAVKDGKYRLRITQNPGATEADNTLDASEAPRGLVFYRVLLPESEVEPPEVREVESS